jgi:hypothetical protein
MKLFDQRSTLNTADFSSFSIELLNLGKFETDWGFYSPSDLDEAYALFNATCGPASFSAIYRSSVKRVMRFFPHFPSRDWTTIGDMRKALTAAGLSHEDADNNLPKYGLALLQLRVNDRPLHPLYSLAQTHWVAVCENCFYDANWGGWLPIQFWEELVLAELQFGSRPVSRWDVRNAIEVLDQEFVDAAFGVSKTRAKSSTNSACMAG